MQGKTWESSALWLRYVLCFLICVTLVDSKSYDGASVGLLIDMHVPGTRRDAQCGSLNPASVQHYLAARWAAEMINNQSVSQGVKLGIEVFDTCGVRDVAMRDVFFAVKKALEPRGKLPLLGLIGMGEPEVVEETVTTLHAFNIPLILASPKLANSVVQEGNILTTAPDMAGVAKPVLAVAKQLDVNSVSLISSCSYIVKKFQQSAMSMGIFIGRILEITKHSKVIGDVVKQFLEESEQNEVIALILDAEEVYNLAKHLRGFKLKNNILLTGSVGLDKNLLKLWKNIFTGGYLIEPHMPELPDFRNYFLNALKVIPTSERLIQEYVEILYNCKWNSSAADRIRDCARLTENELAEKLQIAPEVTFIVKAVSAFSAAMFLVQVEHCQDRNISQCIHLNNMNLQQEVLSVLSQLSFTSQHKAPFELQGTSLHLTHDGQLISNKYAIFYIRDNGDVSGTGWYSDEQGLVIDEGTDPMLHHKKFINHEKQGRGFEVESFTTAAAIREFFEKNSVMSLSEATANSKFGDDHGSGVNARQVTPESSLARSWATVMVAIAAVGICITMFILVYVLIKICDRTLAGNQSFGVILLLGIMTLYASVIIFVLPASESRCTLRAFVYPIAMSLCYGILIIQVMQLRSLVLLGLGGRISYINQYIILFFIVLVQVVINVQWYLTNRPQFHIDSEGSSYCYMPRTDFLLLHLYITILVIIAFLYGLSVLKIGRNYREGHWVTLASFLTMLVLVVLGLIYFFVPEKYDDPLVCVTLISLATVLVLVIFIPKMNTISKQIMHFKHKQMHISDSMTTVLSTFTDLHNSSVNESRKKGVRSPQGTSHLSANMLEAYADNTTKNPVYKVTRGAYP